MPAAALAVPLTAPPAPLFLARSFSVGNQKTQMNEQSEKREKERRAHTQQPTERFELLLLPFDAVDLFAVLSSLHSAKRTTHMQSALRAAKRKGQ
jgi:hypothetical protein